MRKYFYWCSCNFKKDCFDQTKLHFKLPDTAEDLSDLVNLAKYTFVNCSARHHGNLLFQPSYKNQQYKLAVQYQGIFVLIFCVFCTITTTKKL